MAAEKILEWKILPTSDDDNVQHNGMEVREWFMYLEDPSAVQAGFVKCGHGCNDRCVCNMDGT